MGVSLRQLPVGTHKLYLVNNSPRGRESAYEDEMSFITPGTSRGWERRPHPPDSLSAAKEARTQMTRRPVAGAGSLATLDVEGKATDVPAPSPRSPDTSCPWRWLGHPSAPTLPPGPPSRPGGRRAEGRPGQRCVRPGCAAGSRLPREPTSLRFGGRTRTGGPRQLSLCIEYWSERQETPFAMQWKSRSQAVC